MIEEYTKLLNKKRLTKKDLYRRRELAEAIRAARYAERQDRIPIAETVKGSMV